MKDLGRDLRRIYIDGRSSQRKWRFGWTDKIEQLEQAKTRVIDMNAQPEQGVNKMKY